MDSVANIILYFVVALIVVIFSVAAVMSRKILRSATYLLFVLIGTAIFYFQLGYQFLGAVQIAVYAGGIVVLFVFSILLTSHPGDNSAKLTSRKRVLGLTGALLMLIVSGYALVSRCDLWSATASGANPPMQEIGPRLLSTGTDGYLLPFEAISVLLLACIIGGVVVARKDKQ